ncbi:MAG: aldehyde dehydrogenase family protein, partial [Candidatus Thermoplasmatota archaeon]|nr:aldehyde dehydrogenase family protein [Candidatus Thermoplasmatota archaeon]
MARLLETGLDLLDAENPHGLPAVKGWNIINGQLTEASDGGRFESRNPANKDDLLGNVPRSTKDDVHAALDAAHAALPGWSSTPAPT